MLSCECNDIDDDGWWYYRPQDYSVMPFKAHSVKCCSCGEVIKPFSLVTMLHRYRSPVNEIELNIEGDEVQLATWYQCEQCSDYYFNLDALGFCLYAGDDMREHMESYPAYVQAKKEQEIAESKGLEIAEDMDMPKWFLGISPKPFEPLEFNG